VLRDGVQVVQRKAGALVVPVAAGPATYQVTADLTRADPVTLSTGVRAEWTFRSDTTAAVTPLPVSTIRFTPELDLTGSAPAGWFELPIEVQRQPGSAAAAVRSLGVQVSYDDGATWTAVPVVRHGQTAVARLRHPSTGFVSLRGSAVDQGGATVTETLIRAYRLG
jgi:hypothetical protein